MGVLDQIKQATNRKFLEAFKQNIKKLSSDQLIALLAKASTDTSEAIIKDLENGATVEDIKKNYRKVE